MSDEVTNDKTVILLGYALGKAEELHDDSATCFQVGGFVPAARFADKIEKGVVSFDLVMGTYRCWGENGDKEDCPDQQILDLFKQET